MAAEILIGRLFMILGKLKGMMILKSIVAVESDRTFAELITFFSTKAVLFIEPMKVLQNPLRKITKIEADLNVGIIRMT